MRLPLLLLILASAHARAFDSIGLERVSAPRRWALGWAPEDPSTVLAASDISGASQMYVVDLKRGRWTQVTDEPAGQRWGALSPDGQWVVFLRDVMGSEIGQLFRAPARGGREEPLIPGFPAKSIMDARFGSSGKTIYFTAADHSGFGVYQFSIGGKRAFTLAFGAREIAETSPSPDERYLAYRVRSEAGDFDVRVVDLASGGEAGVLAVANGSSESFGAWSPDGRRLLVTSDARGRAQPGVWDLAASTVTWLEPDLDGEVAALDWFPGDRGELLLLQTDQGRTVLWRYVPSSAPSGLGIEGRVTWARVRPGGGVWAVAESGSRPKDVVDESGRPALPAQGRRKTPPGRAARWIGLTSADGAGLNGWLTAPEGPRAALVWLHEGPGRFSGDEWDPLRLALADEGLAVLAVNYRGSVGVSSAPATEGELQDVATAREWLVRELGVSASSVAVAGRFYGGMLALQALAQQPELWAAGASLGGIADWARLYEDGSEPVRAWCRRMLGADPESAPERYAERSPASRAFTIRAPILLVHAENDSRAPISQMQAFDARLQDAGKAHRLVVLKGGQAESAQEQRTVVEAFVDFLKKAGL